MDFICQLSRVCHRDCRHKFKHPVRNRCLIGCPYVAIQQTSIKDQSGDRVDLLLYKIAKGYCVSYPFWQEHMGPGVDYIDNGRVIAGLRRTDESLSYSFEEPTVRVYASNPEDPDDGPPVDAPLHFNADSDGLSGEEMDEEWDTWIDEQSARVNSRVEEEQDGAERARTHSDSD